MVEAASPRENVVYFIQPKDRQLVKIGTTNDIRNRIVELQCGSPEALKVLGLMPGGRQLETEMHYKFSGDRMRGEWFYLSKDLFRFIVWNAMRNVPEMREFLRKHDEVRKHDVRRKTFTGWATEWMDDVLDEVLDEIEQART